MNISPIPNTHALKIGLEEEKIVAISDLHLGISAELSDKGIEIPSRIPEVRKRLLKIVNEEGVDRLFLLGDVKHNIPVTSWQEWENLPGFFGRLSKKTRVEIVPGNHDGDIEGLITRDVTLHEAEGTTIGDGKVGLIHGHAWPAPKLLKADSLVMGHNHPMIEFRDELGGKAMEPAWVRTKIKPENLPENLKQEVNGPGPEVTIVPAFSKLVGGSGINRGIPEKFLGPLFKAGAIDLEEADIYLVDGTFLGKLRNFQE